MREQLRQGDKVQGGAIRGHKDIAVPFDICGLDGIKWVTAVLGTVTAHVNARLLCLHDCVASSRKLRRWKGPY